MSRNIFLTVILCLGSVAQLYSNEPTKQQLAKRNYLALLQSEHEGVRNSTIFRVLQYKVAYPQDDCAVFIKRLQRLSLDDACVKNRMYAVLACALLQDAKLLATVPPPLLEEEKEKYFARLHGVLQKNLAMVMNAE